MPYVIVVKEDNSLSGSSKIKIMQREKLFNKLWILVAPHYNGYDMSQCTVTMRYLLPISKEFKTETLILSEERYKEYLKYTLPIDTGLTKEHGDIELNLTFTMLDVDVNGNIMQRVRKTENYLLHITQIPDWDSVIPDSALSSLDQRIIKTQAQIRELEYLAETLGENQVDNLVYDNIGDTLQLTAKGKGVGDKVSVKDMVEDGVPVVDFNGISGGNNSDDDNGCGCNCNCNCEDDVVEFDDVKPSVKPEDSDVVEF